MIRTALIVITHDTPDDVGNYERMWQHMNEDAVEVFRACSKATILFWNAICRNGPPPYRCLLRRIQDYFIIHINIFHAIEKSRADVISYEDEGFRRVCGGFCPYGEISAQKHHSFHTIFCRAVYIAEKAYIHTPYVRSIAFFDEQIVARCSRVSAVSRAFKYIHTHERVSILCDRHERVRADIEDPESERHLLEDAGCAKDETNAIEPCAFIIPCVQMRVAREAFRASSDEERTMCYVRFRDALRPQEIHPPVFWQLHDYLSPHHLPFSCDSIENAISHIQQQVLLQQPPLSPAPVPSFVHQIWVGREMPAKWKALHHKTQTIHGPEHTKLYTNADLGSFPRTMQYLSQSLFPSYAAISDALRIEILYMKGGFYIDTDFNMFRSLFMLSRSSLTMVKEYIPWSNSVSKNIKTHHCCGGFLASPQFNLYMLLYISFYSRFIVVDPQSGWSSTISAGSYLMQHIYKSCRKLFNSTLRRRVLSFVPTSYLFDTTRKHFKSYIPGNSHSSIGRHLYASSWN